MRTMQTALQPDRGPAPMQHAVVIVLRRGGRVLMIRRGPHVPRAGVWTPPSGRIEPGEGAAETVVREAREELGLTVRALRQVWRSRTDDGAFDLHWWLAEERGGELLPDPDEVAEWRWILPSRFDRLHPVFPSQRPFFSRLLPHLLSEAGAAG